MLFSLLLLLAARAAEAGSPLTIEEAAALAAEQAPAVTRALAETDRARARFSATRSRLGPSLTADLGFFGTDDPVGAFRLALQQERFSPSEFFASDPNLGRILAAIGYAGIDDLDVSNIRLWLDDVLVAKDGGRNPDYQEADGQRVMKQAEISVRIALGRGQVADTVYTCDFSHEYVTINADYRS